MTRTNIYIKFIFIVFGLTTIIKAQSKFSVLFKAGSADYSIALGNFGGSSPYYLYWNDGFHISAGIEFPLNEDFSFQGLGEYSAFKFNTDFSYQNKVNNAKTRIFNLMGDIKWNLGIFYFIGGFGLSAQKGDEVRYLEKNEFNEIIIILPSRKKIVFTGILGLGFDIMVYKRISFIAEVDIRIRKYAGLNTLLGIKYSFW